MRFVGLALISALAASGATWGCQNAPAPASETASLQTPAAAQLSPDGIAAGAEVIAAPLPGGPTGGSPEKSPEAAPDVVRGVAAHSAEVAPSGVTRIALQGDDLKSHESKLLAAGGLSNDGLSEDRLLQDPLIGDTLIGDGEPMDDVDDAASGVSEPDPDQAGAPNEPPAIPHPAALRGAPGAGQAEPRGTAPENQQR